MESPPRAVVIGASAGAIEALSAILPALPADFGRAILIVVHLPPDRKSILAEIFADKCRLQVREADDKEPILANSVYFAPPDYHMLVETDHYLSLSNEEPVHYSRPSIDILFTTAAEAFKSDLIGVILSGANQDGAEGLRAIENAGGVVLVQQPEQASSSVMPRAALARCRSARALTLDGIASALCELAAG